MLNEVFGAEMPIALRIAILAGGAVAVFLIAILAYNALFGSADDDVLSAPPPSSRFGIPRMVIWLAEKLAFVFVLMATILGAVVGVAVARAWGPYISPRDIDTYTWVGGFAGSMGALTLSSLLTGLLFTLTEIERNTRRTAAMLESMRR
jgi:hypothetical protein